MRYVLVFLFCLVMSQLSYATRHFIIDTDLGSDDAIAILYLLQRPDIKIDAITVVGNGEVACEPALRNLQGLLQLMQQANIPIACGRETPLVGQHRFPTYLSREQATLSGTHLLLPKTNPMVSSLSAVDLLIKTLNQATQPVTLLAIGPLTNLAEAFEKAPQIKNNIQGIFIMGGAVFVPGNINGLEPTSKNKVAEWNIYIDPVAADKVFQQSLPITLVSLDITNQVPLSMAFYKKLERNRHTAATQYVYALLTGNLHWIRENNFYFWDPLAAIIASDESIATFSYQPLKVSVTPELESGMTAVNQAEGQPIRIVTAIDKKRVEALLLSALNRS
jgi:inosine-uridine nucleoside N-ribohydrolase